MMKLAAFIVDKRNLFFLITIIALVFSVISQSWFTVENELAEYLLDDSGSRQGLDVMTDQFTTYGTAQIMVANIPLSQAESLYDSLWDVDGVQSVVFDSDSSMIRRP